MTKEQIESEVAKALAPLEPVEIRIHQDSDMLNILVLSNKFERIGVFKRITQVIDMLEDRASEQFLSSYLTVVEPVTPEEFKTRNAPWPE